MKKLSLSLLAALLASAAHADINHQGVSEIKIGERAFVEASLTPVEAIKTARLYFKSNLSEQFIYVDLDLNGELLSANLPAPGESMQNIEYFFAVKYSSGVLEQSSVYNLAISNEWLSSAQASYNKTLTVHSELDKSKDDTEQYSDKLKNVYNAGKMLDASGQPVNLANYSNSSSVASSANANTVAGSSTAAVSSSSVVVATGLSTATGLSAATWAGVGAGTAAVALAAGGSGGNDGVDTSSRPVIATDFEGRYTLLLKTSTLSKQLVDYSECLSGAVFRLNNVDISVDGSSFSATASGFSDFLNGSVSGATASVAAGSGDVSSTVEGISSTDQLTWTAFSLSRDSNGSLSSNSFLLTTYEQGIAECEYQASIESE